MSRDLTGRCRWCGIRLGRIRRLWTRYCPLCWWPMCGDAGLYLQGGGPPCPHMSRWNEQ